MIMRPIKKEDFKLLLKLDKKVYPSKTLVTTKNLSEWYSKNPEFGLIYEKNYKIAGLCAAIPLNSISWRKLVNGNLTESNLSIDDIFDNSKDDELGIYNYHIEKLDFSIKHFYRIFLQDLSEITKNLKKQNPKLKIIGFSGICAASSGIGLFYNKLNCREREYINSEHILRKKNKKIIIETQKLEDIKKKIDEGYEYETRCKLLVTFPSEESLVWSYLS